MLGGSSVKPRRPLPLYDGYPHSRVGLCCGDTLILFKREHAAEVRRTLSPVVDGRRRLSHADVARLESLIDEVLYDPPGSVR
jgi:hypothetical protein